MSSWWRTGWIAGWITGLIQDWISAGGAGAGGAGAALKRLAKHGPQARAALLVGSLLLWAPLAKANPTPSQGLGVWFTTVDSQVLYSPEEAETALAFLEHNGFRRAAVPLYTGGYLTWPVAPDHNNLGVPLDPRLPTPTRTQALLTALGQRGMERVGWLEFGLMAPADAPWLQGHQDLLLRDSQGSTLWQESPGLHRVWLNPALPAVQNALVNLVVDACTSLPLDLIQLDDHLGYPVRFGYDPTTLALWQQTAPGASHPQPKPDDPDWIDWRSRQVTALLAQIRSAMARECPRVKLSVAPNPQDFSKANYLADWGQWIQQGLVDELVVQIYRNDPARLAWELGQPSLQAALHRLPVRVGLLAGLKHQPQDPTMLRRQLAMANGAGITGIDLFFYESARRHFPAPGPSAPPTLPEPADRLRDAGTNQPPTGGASASGVGPATSRSAGGAGINGNRPQ